MVLKLRKFNDAGTMAFQKILINRSLDSADQTSLFEQLRSLILDSTFTSELAGEIEINPFKKRHDLAKYLWGYFGDSGSSKVYNLGDPNLWNWLSAAWLECLVVNHDRDECRDCKKNAKDISKLIGNFQRWTLMETSRRYHWHVLSHPFFVYQANSSNPDSASAFLASDVLHPGDLVDKIASNRRFIGRPVSELATLLYYDTTTQSLRTGISNRMGEVNQLSRFLNQVDRTVDFESMDAEALVSFLPDNFKEWVVYAKVEIANRNVND
jgi:hypothetical protein